MKPRILFVDDDNNILQGLRRSLRQQRGVWDMDFAAAGDVALTLLEVQPADVVVTDMKMPGMNGAALLDEVARLYPRSQRYILSGEADSDATFRTVTTSHRFLQKPSDSARLVAIVEAGLHRRDALAGAGAQTLVTAANCLAVSRSSATHLAGLVAEENLALERVGDIFCSEPALAAKVMQLANSAYFGVGDPVADPKAAVAMLGQDVLRALLAQDFLLQICPDDACQAFYERSVSAARDVADLAAWITEQQGGSRAEIVEARLGGLLQGLGRLLLCHQAPSDYTEVLSRVAEGAALEAAERAVFGLHHGAFGAYLAQIWGLPAAVVEAIGPAGAEALPLPDGEAPLPVLAARQAQAIVTGIDTDGQAAQPRAGEAATPLQQAWMNRGSAA